MPAISLRTRDIETLRMLSRTQATAALILKAGESFELPEDEEPYRDQRRVRERLQKLATAGLVRSAPIGMPSGSVANWYRLAVDGFRTVCGASFPLPPKTFFDPIRISRQEHTMRLAEFIVHTLVAARRERVQLVEFRRENELKITGGPRVQYPDAYLRLAAAGRQFNLMVELDNGTEPLDSPEPHSIRHKIATYEAHQDQVLAWWAGQGSPRRLSPRFRVLFVTRSAERAEHIVALARELTQNSDRLLCYAVCFDDYLAEPDALRRPMCLDHHGRWQMLVNTHPSSCPTRAAVRLATPFASVLAAC